MATIQCGNCGSTHESVADVRACHTASPSVDPSPAGDARDPGWDDPAPWFDEFEPPAGAGPVGSPRTTPRTDSTPVGGARRGHPDLGRSVLIGAGAEPPAEWNECRRIAIDARSFDSNIIDELHDAWFSREAVVVELVGELPPATTLVDVVPWRLEPALELDADRLRHLLTANCVDARSESHHWPTRSLAIAHGAAAGADHDVIIDGEEVWLDGGPFGTHPLGIGTVVHLTSVETGSLAATGAAGSAAELADDQLTAVDHKGGPARVIAPAGSGKTRVLTERARLLLGGRNHPAKALTLVAFNKRAQLEMEERTTDLAGLQVRTLNSLGLAIVRGTAGFRRSDTVPRGVEVITERDVRRILDGMLDLRRRANTDQLAPWLEALTAVRLGLRDPAEVERSFAGDVDGLGEVVVRYRRELRERHLVDFDEQIIRAIEVLLADPEARAAAQRTCRTMLVDEFQDLTPAHMLLVRILASPGFDVYGVGDDDQTIYGFTGASPDWLIDYARWFPNATEHALEVNYRCPPAVVAAADMLLTHNIRRVEKVIRPAPERVETPNDLDVVAAGDPIEATVQRLADLVEAATAPADMIVLTRVNATLAPIQVALRAQGLPVEQAVDTQFLQRSGVRAVLAWLRLASGGAPFSSVDIDLAARRPSRGISPRVVQWMGEQRDLAALRRLAGRIDRGSDKVEEFVDDLESLLDAQREGATTADLIEMIRDELGLAGSLDALDASRRSVDRSSHGDDLAALLALGRLQSDAGTFEPWLADQLAQPGDPDGIRLSTVHRVKGREWPHVVVLGADTGMFPHRLADDVEEERRVFHVAITRASSTATVVATAGSVSRFVEQCTTRRDPAAEIEAAPRLVRSSAASARPSRSDDGPMRTALREWRRTRAQADGVPAYVVFNDKTLDDLIARCPTDLRSLGRCHGIGPAKLDRFGDELLGVMDATRS